MALTVSPGDPTIPLGPSKPGPPWTNVKININIFNYLTLNILLLVLNKYLTGISAERIRSAVPPDAINLNPKSWSFLANSTSPSLLETLRIAVEIASKFIITQNLSEKICSYWTVKNYNGTKELHTFSSIAKYCLKMLGTTFSALMCTTLGRRKAH